MNLTGQKNIFRGIMLVSVICIVCVLSTIRLFFGVDLTDEAYTVAETYMVSEGALPFVNNWSQMPGYTLLLAPFVKVFTALNGGTDGIVLFFRFLSLGINFATATALFLVLRRYVGDNIALGFSVLIFLSASGRDYTISFRGDNLSIDLMAVGASLLAADFTGKKKGYIFIFISGVLISLAVMSYPSLILEYVYILILLFFLLIKEKNIRKLWVFIGGSAVSAAAVIFYLAINSGIMDIFNGIAILLKDVSYFQLENDYFLKVPSYLKVMVKHGGILFLLILGNFLLITTLFHVFSKKDAFNGCTLNKLFPNRKHGEKIALASILTGVIAYHLFIVWSMGTNSKGNISIYALTIEAVSVPALLPFIKSKKTLCKYLMEFIWIPAFLLVIVTGIATYNSIFSRHYLLKAAAFLLFLFSFFAVKDVFFDANEKDVYGFRGKLKRPALMLFPVIITTLFLLTYLFDAYVYVYRDAPIYSLNTEVEDGPYKGIYTTEERSCGLEKLEDTLKTYIDEDDTLLAMNTCPFVYLMSDAEICTPSTWDQSLYSQGFDSPDLYYDYFKITGTNPSKIVYFNFGIIDQLSIDTDYKFNKYVFDNYEKVYENRAFFEWDYCGERVDCELLIFNRAR